MDIKFLLKFMTDHKASDLHLVVNSPPILRISTVLKPIANEKPLDPKTVEDLVFPMLTEDQKSALIREKELDLAYELEQSRFRVNVHYERGHLGCAIRRIPRRIPTLEELGLPNAIANFAKEKRGLVLVTGPTGSGKTTTQASMLDVVNNSRACHIITVEDPIEYVHEHKKSIIEQREVGMDTLGFGRALKRVLRQDPDVILVGEMRDLETIQTAITAAETGHLVISTLHTTDAPQTIDRIIDVFPPYQQPQIRLQLSMTLRGIISQQLLARKDGTGVIPALEIMAVTPAVRNIIRKASTQELYSQIEIGRKHGMQSMDSAILEHYRKGIISYYEAMVAVLNPDSFTKKLKEEGLESGGLPGLKHEF